MSCKVKYYRLVLLGGLNSEASTPVDHSYRLNHTSTTLAKILSYRSVNALRTSLEVVKRTCGGHQALRHFDLQKGVCLLGTRLVVFSTYNILNTSSGTRSNGDRHVGGMKRAHEGQGTEGQPQKRAVALKVHQKRARGLNDIKGDTSDGPIVYWMSRDQRVRDNWALLYALECAGAGTSGGQKKPVAVVFNLVTEFMGAGARQFVFMLEGLKRMQPILKELNIPFFLLQGDPTEEIPKFVDSCHASLLVTDFSPLRLGRTWREGVSRSVDIPVHEVDAHNIVPVWVASDKREYAARTIRKKIHDKLPEFLREFPEVPEQVVDWPSECARPSTIDWDMLIKEARTRGAAVPEVSWLTPGEDAAMKALHGPSGFLSKSRLSKYATKRNDPSVPGALSGLSPYFHFGHLSPQRAALEASKQRGSFKDSVDGFLEEMVVRRELSDNYCFYVPNYDSLDAAYDWAKDTLNAHRNDKREHLYTLEQLEKAQTHDKLWNAAQKEMTSTGKMHGYIRMYWAKKILEWTESPEQAIEFGILLNDKWELDGRDPNGYVGVMWSMAGIHDQGWSERPVFGKIRYMNYQGCKRKFDIEKYIARVESESSQSKLKF